MQHQTDIFDNNFDEQRLPLCRLLCEFATDSIAYSVLDLRNGKIVLLKELIANEDESWDEIENYISRDALLKIKYNSAIISSVSNSYVLIPSSFYDEEKKEMLFQFGKNTHDDEIILSSRLKMPESNLIYCVNKKQQAIVNRFFADAVTTHHMASLIQLCMQRFRYKSEPVVIINVRKCFYDLLIISEGKLHLANSFEYPTKEDFIYYILFACEQMKFNPQSVSMILCGNISKESTHFEILKKYCSNISFLSRTLNHGFNNAFEDLEPHRFTTLFDLNLCAS